MLNADIERYYPTVVEATTTVNSIQAQPQGW